MKKELPGRSHGRWRAVYLTGVFTAVMTCGPALPAMATGPATPPPSASACNAMIIDATAGRVLHADSAVTRAAQQLESKGADVRIRVLDAAPGGSLDAYEANQVAACPSWSSQGEIKPTLLVFLVSLDHKDAIFYGANYSRMQGQVDQIRTDMGSDFRSGDFAAGIAKGEQETYSSLYPSGTPLWQVIGTILVIILVIGVVIAMGRGKGKGSHSRPGHDGAGYIPVVGGGGMGGGFGSDGGTAGGSSGSW